MLSHKIIAKNNLHNIPIKSFYKTSFIDWRGHISSVVFLGGCNFRCPYCHNKELVLWPERIANIPFSDIEAFINANKEWIDGIVISGGEPCLNPELPEFCSKLRTLGMKIKLDTNGSMPEIIELLINEKLIDYIAMDFKAPLNEFSYRRCTGVRANIKKIEKSLDLILNGKIEYEFRVTLCAHLLNLEDIKIMGERIRGAKRFVLQNFIPHNTLEASFSDIPPYTLKELNEMKEAMSFYTDECLLISPF